MSNARLSIFKIYCRTHQSVDIETIAEKMSLEASDAENYIIRLIQSGKLSNACIDTDSGGQGGASVFFPKQKSDVSSQVLEKTKNMSFRLFLLSANCARLDNKKDNKKLGQLSAELSQHLN